jgi:ATP-dependent DNA helicase RecG
VNQDRATEKLWKEGVSERVAVVQTMEPWEKVAQHVCAMLNGQGGTVLVGGQSARGSGRMPTEEDAVAARQLLQEKIVPRALLTVSLDPTSAGRVISVDVPAGQDRPYCFDGTVYVRSGRQTTRADVATLRAMVEAKALEVERWERRPALGLELADLDGRSLEETERRAQERRGYRFQDPRNSSAVLMQLGLLRSGQLTNAADVLYGRQVAVRLSQTRLRAVCYETDKGGRYIDERLFEGPALGLIEDVLAFLQRHVAIAAEFPAGSLRRESRPQYPFEALREGVVNALVHRDYAAFSGGVSVSVYPARVEIWNSGHLPEGVSLGDLRRPAHASILVNPDISHVFYLHEFMERVGRGTFKIIQQCQSLGMRPPQWKDEQSGVRLTLFAATRRKASQARWNERQQALLHELRAGEALGTGEYRKRFAPEMTERQARRDLDQLKAEGYLQRRGAGRTSRYERTEKDWKTGQADKTGH